MTDDEKQPVRPTLASTNRDVAALTETVDDLVNRVRKLAEGDDYEAVIAGRCAKALDALVEHAERGRSRSGYGSLQPSYGYANGPGNTYPYQPLYDGPTGPVPRVLDYLRQRHGMPDPAAEAKRLSDELFKAYQRIGELEGRLQQITAATGGAS